MPNHFVSVPTTLRPTTEQARRLSDIVQQANHLHLTLRRWLRLRGAGVVLTLRAALDQVAAGQPLPDVHDRCELQLPAAALDEVRALTVADLPQIWGLLSPATVRAICHSNAKRLEKRRTGRAAELLPLRPLNAVPMDASVQPLDEFRVLLDGLRTPIVADAWMLPGDLMDALLIAADEQTRQAQQHVTDTCERMIRGELSALTALYADASTIGERLLRSATRRTDQTRPHRADYVQLRVVTEPAGGQVYQLVWTVRVPYGHRPLASIDDTIGVDLGVRNLATLADDSSDWHVPRQTTTWDLPAPDPDDSHQLLIHAMARRAVFELHRPHLELALQRILSYRRAHLEELDYDGMRDHGRVPWAGEAMQLSGASSLTGWVQMLAGVTGTRVRMVDPAGTSSRCPHCHRPCRRISPFVVTTCPVHGDMDADVVGARMIRQG